MSRVKHEMPPCDVWQIEAIGSAIRIVRCNLNMTQNDLSKKSGVSATKIPRIENGQTDFKVSTLQRIARGLGVHISALIPLKNH